MADPSVIIVTGSPAARFPVLVADLSDLHPDSSIVEVPAWPDPEDPLEPPETLGYGWNRLILAIAPDSWALARGASLASQLLRTGTTGSVAIVLAGSILVDARLEGLPDGADLVLIDRTDDPPPADGLWPTLAELVQVGTTSPSLLVARSAATDHLDDLRRWLCEDPTLTPGRALDLLRDRSGVVLSSRANAPFGPWRAPAGTSTALVDASMLDPDRPWLLSTEPRAPRVRLSDHPDLERVVVERAGQVRSARSEVVLPGNVTIDDAMRSVVAADLSTHLIAGTQPCPDPFTDTSDFLRWLDTGDPPGRYWDALLDQRIDLQEAFPETQVGRYGRFRRWTSRSWITDGTSFLLRGEGSVGHDLTDASREPGGVNVVGYLDRASGLGEAARSLANAFEAAGVAVSRTAIGGTSSPYIDSGSCPRLDQALRYDTNLLVITAEQFPRLPLLLGPDALSERHTIGYWFWELSEPSPTALHSAHQTNQIWTASRFVQDAFVGRVPVPVRLVPLPRPNATASALGRAELGLPVDRFVFLCSFDLFSVLERKNPLGVLSAFTRAFAPDEGPVLVFKTINGDERWQGLEQLLLAVGARPDVMILDRTMDRADHHALVRESDCLVSLHRSEGLGLHLLEAMALDTPVIATGWSGPADFLDPTNAEIVPHQLIPVTHGEGAYPEGTSWADPDLDAAARVMRRLVSDADRCSELVDGGRRTISSLPDERTVGLRMRALLSEGAPKP